MIILSALFSALSETLSVLPDEAEVELRHNAFFITPPRPAASRLLDYARLYFSPPREGNSETWRTLRLIFGNDRLNRILERAAIKTLSAVITKREIGALFIHAAEVYEFDLEELLDEIHQATGSIRYLSEHDSQQLKIAFPSCQRVDQCTDEQLGRLFQLLIPFESIDYLFLKNVPACTGRSFDSGKTIKGISERVLFYERMRRTPPSEPEWFYIVAKRLVDREVPAGVVFRNGVRGFCKVHMNLFAAGAYKCFLKQIGYQGLQQRNVVAYRGTRGTPTATDSIGTVLEDLRYEFGAEGPKATYEATRRMLSDPHYGFVREPTEKVIGVGMSLGANHLTRDVVLLRDKFHRVVPLCGPGLDRSSSLYFSELVNQSNERAPKLEFYWEADDLVHHMGDMHLGAGCDPAKIEIEINLLHVIEADLSQQDLLFTAKQFGAYPRALLSLVESMKAATRLLEIFATTHGRLTTTIAHRRVTISNQTNPALVDRLLRQDPNIITDPRWEQFRKNFSPSLLDNQPFAAFAKEKHS